MARVSSMAPMLLDLTTIGDTRIQSIEQITAEEFTRKRNLAKR